MVVDVLSTVILIFLTYIVTFKCHKRDIEFGKVKFQFSDFQFSHLG